MLISIIIPCYNESKNISRGVLSDIHNYFKKAKFRYEVIISDDGSTDDSFDLVRKEIKSFKNFTHLKNIHGGKPSAIMSGIKKANGEWVLFTDMDQSTPVSEIEKLLPYLNQNYDAIIGSRGLTRKDFPIYRQLGALVFSNFRRLLILREIQDTQCGFKLFKRKIVADTFPKLQFFRVKERVTGWKVTSYDVELLHLIKKAGGKIKEVKVRWADTDTSDTKGGGLSKYYRESVEMLMQILRVKVNDLKGLYE